MKSDFTFNDLIVFAFNDTLEKNDPERSDAMESFDEFKHEFKELLENSSFGHRAGTGPNQRIINNIMGYSRALNVIPTRQTGVVNLLVN